MELVSADMDTTVQMPMDNAFLTVLQVKLVLMAYANVPQDMLELLLVFAYIKSQDLGNALQAQFIFLVNACLQPFAELINIGVVLNAFVPTVFIELMDNVYLFSQLTHAPSFPSPMVLTVCVIQGTIQ